MLQEAMTDAEWSDVQRLRNMVARQHRLLLEARYELGVAASYRDDPEVPIGLQIHGKSCHKVLILIDKLLDGTDADP